MQQQVMILKALKCDTKERTYRENTLWSWTWGGSNY